MILRGFGLLNVMYASPNAIWGRGNNLPWNNPSEYISLGGHGNKGEGEYNLGGYWTDEDIQNIIDKIKDLEKYKNNPNMPIEIEACYVGETKIPQMIADGTGRPVKAYGGEYYPGFGFGFYPHMFYPNSHRK